MPNMHSPLKKLFSVQITQDVYRKLEKVSETTGMKITNLVASILSNHVSFVKLSDEDEIIIAERIQEAIRRRSAKYNKESK